LPRLSEIAHAVPGRCYGVVRQEQPDSDRLQYHAAVEVTKIDALPRDMAQVEIPEATYATFTHRGFAQNLDHTVNYVYSTWLAQSDRRHTYGPDLEIYGKDYHPTRPDSVIYYAIPIAV
jgi:AraC family transcriptional regulator